MKKAFSALLALVLLLSCLTGFSLAADTATKVPEIANASASTAFGAVITNPSTAAVEAPAELSLAQKQEVLVQTALAYYYQNPYVQYDGNEVTLDNSIERHKDFGAPEDAAVDSQVYSVCSNYCWKVYYEAFGYKVNGDSTATKVWSQLAKDNPMVVYKYKGEGGETDVKKALTESRKVLQPGDIIVGYGSSGHAMLYVGDCLDDGKEYVLHCWGASYNMTTGEDKPEADGSIKLQTVDECCYSKGPSPNWYLAEDSRSSLGFTILRPLQDPKFPATATASGLGRLAYPGLKITRELDRTKFASTQSGEEILVTVTISNQGQNTIKEVPVTEYIPQGATLVAGSVTNGAKIEGNTIKWAVKLPVNESISLSYKVKLSGNLGDTIVFTHGNVGGVPSRETTLTLGGKTLTDAQRAAVSEYAQKLADAGSTGAFQDVDFFNEFYKGLFGVDLGLPKTTAEVLTKLGKATISALQPLDQVALEDSPLKRMIIPLHFSGQTVANKDNWDRVRDYNEMFYEVGDLFICLSGKSKSSIKNEEDITLFVYMGNNKVLEYTTAGAKIRAYSKTMNKALGYNVLIALRPTLAYADLMARTPGKMTFSDVKAADWFYSYVKDLVYDGAVNGMTATSFAPNGNLTYGQALKLITLAVGESEQAAVSGGHWASGYEKLAAAKGWIAGSVDLNKNITRLQFCQIAAKAAGITGAPAKNPFTDCSDAAVLALNNAGVINGMTATTFAPGNLLTRAQISKIIWCLREAM